MRLQFKQSTYGILARAVLVTWLHRICGVVSGIVTIPILVRDLGIESYGIWVLISQAISFMALSDFGGASALGRMVARCRGSNDERSLEKLLSTTMAILVGAGVLVAFMASILASSVPAWVGIPESSDHIARVLFLILGWSLALQFPMRIGQGLLIGYQLYGLDGLSKTFDAIAKLVAIVILHRMECVSLLNVAVLYALVSIVSHALLTTVVWKMTSPWRMSIRKISLQMGRAVLSIGCSSVVTTLSNLAYTSGLGIAAGRLLGLQAAGIYGVVYSIMSNVYPFISAACVPFVSLSSEWQASGQSGRLRLVSVRVMRLAFLMAICIAVIIGVYAEPILRILFSLSWSADDYHVAALALVIMSAGMALGLPQLVSRATLQGTGRHWHATWAIILASVSSITIGSLAMWAGFGIPGAALGWSVSWLVQGIAVFLPICKYHELPLRQSLISVYLPGLVVGLLVYGTSACLSRWVVPGNVGSLMVWVMPSVMVSAAGIYIVSGLHAFLKRRTVGDLT